MPRTAPGTLLPALLLAACVVPPPGGTGRGSGGPRVRTPVETGWMEAIDIGEEHESGNVGDTTIDLVWVTLK